MTHPTPTRPTPLQPTPPLHDPPHPYMTWKIRVQECKGGRAGSCQWCHVTSLAWYRGVGVGHGNLTSSPITLTLNVISVHHEGDHFKIWDFYSICKKGRYIWCLSQFLYRNSQNPRFVWFIFEFSRLSCQHLSRVGPTRFGPSLYQPGLSAEPQSPTTLTKLIHIPLYPFVNFPLYPFVNFQNPMSYYFLSLSQS